MSAVPTLAHDVDVPTAEPPLTVERALQRRGGLLFLLRTRRGLVSAAAMASVLAAGLALVPFFAVAEMVVAVQTENGAAVVRRWAWITAAAVLLRYLLVAASSALAQVAAFNVLHDLRIRLARKLGEVPLSFFARHGSGSLKRTLMDDVNQIEAFVAHHFPDCVAATSVPLLTVVVLLWVDWRMALASLAMAPLAALSMMASMRNGDEKQRSWLALQERTNASLLEYFRGIHVIKTFGLAASRFGELARSIEQGSAWMHDYMRTNGRGYGRFAALIGSSTLILLPLGGWLHLRGSLSLHDLVLFLVLGPQVIGSCMRLMFAWGNVMRIQEGNQRIVTVLSAESLQDADDRPESRPRDHGVRFHEVGFRYDTETSVETLRGVSFTARTGKVTAIVGPSGAGKTTLLRLLPRFWEPSRGVVELGGVDVRDMPLDALLARIAVVFQDVFLFQGSVRDNLRLGRAEASQKELEAACRAARAHDFITALPKGYDTELGERGARLSGSEKQRLSIARALLKDAPILLLDEATAFADPENEALIQDALAELCKGRTVLVVAHRLSSVTHADSIVVMDAGQVVDQGRHDELLARCALYRTLWQNHQRAAQWTLETGVETYAAEAP